jgi:hypothetical protein
LIVVGALADLAVVFADAGPSRSANSAALRARVQPVVFKQRAS